MKRLGLSLLILALIVGMTGCAAGSSRPVRYDLTVASVEGGSVDIPGEGTFICDADRVVDLVAIPASGYRFVNWTGDVDTINNPYAASTTITMNDDYSITANFEQTGVTYYTLTTSVSPSGGGSVSPTGGTYAAGSQVTLTATPAFGYSFSNWGGDASGSQNPITITMNSNKSITANFEETGVTYYTLTTSVSPSGGGSVSPTGGTYAAGSQVTLTATPAFGYSFSNWGGDASGSQNPITITMNSNKSITANFEGVNFMVSAGGYHSVGLKADGTVVAVGYNYHGECNVGDWTNIIQVAAGDYHTVGLKSDGTVVAVGDNDHGQCDVGDWTNIIQVAAGGYHTVGLKLDDTVVAVGDNDHGQCDVGNWTDIMEVAAGLYHTVGVKSDGTAVPTGDNYWGQCDVGDWTNIIEVAAGLYHTVGLKFDGTVVAVGYNYHGQCDVSGWTGIIQVTAGWEHTVGVKSDGTVVAVGANWWGMCSVSSWTGIIQVSAGFCHTVGLRSDGTVVAAGADFWEQRDVGGWDLN